MALWTGFGVSGTAGAAAVGAAAVAVAGVFGYQLLISPPVPDVEPAVIAPEPTPQITQPDTPVAVAAPVLDVVRIDARGNAVIAGRASPARPVSMRVDGAEAFATTTDGGGNFVALFQIAPAALPRLLTVVMTTEDGTEVAAEDQIVIAPIDSTPQVALAVPSSPTNPDETAAVAPVTPLAPPRIVRANASGVTIVQGAPEPAPDVATSLGLDTISYDAEGEVILSGRGQADGSVRVYLDNKAVLNTPIDGGGAWTTALPDIDTGIYTLRIDAIDADGQVTSRLETPFERTAPELAAEAAGKVSVITVQPGFTLWGIARDQFGDGALYVQLYDANKSLIRDPDLIYPGQVFAMPEAN